MLEDSDPGRGSIQREDEQECRDAEVLSSASSADSQAVTSPAASLDSALLHTAPTATLPTLERSCPEGSLGP